MPGNPSLFCDDVKAVLVFIAHGSIHAQLCQDDHGEEENSSNHSEQSHHGMKI